MYSNFGKMVQVFILACAPWYCYFLSLYGFELPRKDAIMVCGAMWMLVSPVIMMIVALVAFREGQWSITSDKEQN